MRPQTGLLSEPSVDALDKQFRKHFRWPAATVAIPVMHTNETIKVDTSPSSEIEAIVEIGFLKWYKADEPDGLCLSFFKDGSDVLMSELTKLLLPI